MDGLHRGDDAERREAGHVVGMHQLRVLDPHQGVSRRGLELPCPFDCVQDGAHGGIADRVHGHVETRGCRLAHVFDDLLDLQRRHPTIAIARARVRLQEMRGPRAECAVGEQLHRSDPQPVATFTRSESQLACLSQLSASDAVVYAQRQLASCFERAKCRQ